MRSIYAVLISLVILLLAPSLRAQSPMRVHFIDVGQGSATLLEFSCGAVLIDTGGELNDESDSTDALLDYLNQFFIRRDDLGRRLTSLMLTHPHIDHTRGVKEVVLAYRPRNAVTNGQVYGSGKGGQIALQKYTWGPDQQDGTSDDIPFQWIRLEDLPPKAGYTDDIVDPLKCEGDIDPQIAAVWGQVTTPRDWGNDRYGKPRYQNNNNHSLAIRVRFGSASLLVTGDMEEVSLAEFVQRYAGTTELDVDVYLAGHHGSVNGTTGELMTAMSPSISVISMGPSARELDWTAWAYGHPRREVVSMLQTAAALDRPPMQVRVGRGARNFTNTTINRSVFATGWDGTIVLEATSMGQWRVVSPSTGTPRINLNTATAQQLLELPGIGPTRANAIVTHRSANGPFRDLRDLDAVEGIGTATLAGIEPYVSVDIQ